MHISNSSGDFRVISHIDCASSFRNPALFDGTGRKGECVRLLVQWGWDDQWKVLRTGLNLSSSFVAGVKRQ